VSKEADGKQYFTSYSISAIYMTLRPTDRCLFVVFLTDLSSGGVRVLLAAGDGGDDGVVKGRAVNENDGEVPAVGMSLHSLRLLYIVVFTTAVF